MAAHDKPIIAQTPLDLSTLQFSPQLTASDFKQSIANYGYDVTIEKALMCPCRDKANGHVDTGCKNCGATGWIFINKKKTRALVSNINQQTKYLDWTEDNIGTVNITTLPEDRVGYMDRVTLLDIDTVMSQIVHVRKSSTNELFAFLAYVPTEIDSIFLFLDAQSELEHLDPNKYSIQHNKLILDNSYLSQLTGVTNLNLQYLNVTIRYFHQPVYHIIDINREVVKSRSKECATGLKALKEFPISSIGKKPHALYEIPDFTGDGLFDNSFMS